MIGGLPQEWLRKKVFWKEKIVLCFYCFDTSLDVQVTDSGFNSFSLRVQIHRHGHPKRAPPRQPGWQTPLSQLCVQPISQSLTNKEPLTPARAQKLLSLISIELIRAEELLAQTWMGYYRILKYTKKFSRK